LGRKENELAQEGETVNTKQPSPVMLSCAEAIGKAVPLNIVIPALVVLSF